MEGKKVGRLVVGAGVVAVLAGIYNLATLPELPESEDGVVGLVLRTAAEDYTEVLEWIATTTAVNSFALVVVGVALILVGFKAEFE